MDQKITDQEEVNAIMDLEEKKKNLKNVLLQLTVLLK